MVHTYIHCTCMQPMEGIYSFLHSTGKGPLKEHYLSLIAKKKFERVTIKTMWLSTEDYPLLLGKHAFILNTIVLV